MNNYNDGNLPPQKNLQDLSNHELMSLYEQYEVGSVNFDTVRAEMVRRGFRFQSNSPREENPPTDASPSRHFAREAKLRYSKGWSLFWEILFVFLGLVLFVVLMEQSGWEPETITGLLYGLAACNIFTLGALVSGVRNLANRKTGHPDAARSGIWQIILGIIWTLVAAAVFYMGIKQVIQYWEWDADSTIEIGIITISVTLTLVAYAITLITLGREMGSAD